MKLIDEDRNCRFSVWEPKTASHLIFRGGEMAVVDAKVNVTDFESKAYEIA